MRSNNYTWLALACFAVAAIIGLGYKKGKEQGYRFGKPCSLCFYGIYYLFSSMNFLTAATPAYFTASPFL